MPTESARRRREVVGGAARVAVGALVVVILIHAYSLRLAAGDGSLFDYFGYFTNQTSLLAAAVQIALGIRALAGRPRGYALTLIRGITASYLMVVMVVYNLLVPGTGSAPPWVSFSLHLLFPLVVVGDWVVGAERLRWRDLWLLLPYPVVWLAVVLVRGATDGWVPYGFLLPERGAASMLLHIVGLLLLLLLAGVLAWLISRWDAGASRRSARFSR